MTLNFAGCYHSNIFKTEKTNSCESLCVFFLFVLQMHIKLQISRNKTSGEKTLWMVFSKTRHMENLTFIFKLPFYFKYLFSFLFSVYVYVYMLPVDRCPRSSGEGGKSLGVGVIGCCESVVELKSSARTAISLSLQAISGDPSHLTPSSILKDNALKKHLSMERLSSMQSTWVCTWPH